MEQVTEQLLLSLTECKTLDEVNVISLRNKNIQSCFKVLASCKNLNICYLQYNRILTSDLINYLEKFEKLQKLDLSFNMIKKLPSGKVFAQLKNLKIFYIHDNLISQWNDLNHLADSPALIHLTLMRNPISQVPGYRHQLVNQMQSLKALDEFIITDEERMQYMSPNAIRFRAMSQQYMKMHVPKFLENQSAEKHLFNLDVDIYRIKRVFEKNSPSIRIQSLYRGYNYRSKAVFSYSQKKQAAIKIQKVARGWLYRKKIKKELRFLLKQNDMDYLLMSEQEYKKYRAVILLEKSIHSWIRRRRKEKLHNYSATMIQKFWRCKYTKHHSFLRALNITEEDCCLYFLKEQKTELYHILGELIESNKEVKKLYSLDDLKKFIINDTEFSMIRYPNPLTFKRHLIPLIQLTTPSYQCRVKVNKGLSKIIENGQHVHNLYTRFSGMDQEKNILSKIKIRMCHYNSHDTSLIFQTRQDKHQAVKMRKIFDNYQELLIFNPMSLQLIKLVCHAIYQNNLSIVNENFLAFFPSLMKRVSAAIQIQQSFRSFLIRMEQKRLLSKQKRISIHPPIEYCFASAIIEQRAVHCISQWWKYIKLKRRLEALSLIYNFVKTINHPIIYIEENIYLNINQILKKQSHQLKFMDKSVNFDFQHPSQAVLNYAKHQRKTQIQCIDGTIQKDSIQSEGIDDQGFHLVISNTNELNRRFKDSPFPQWMLNDIPDFQKFVFNENTQSRFMNNYLGIIHKSQFEQMSVVKDYNEIVSHHDKQLNLNNGLNFVQINCCSIGEAKKRALLISLLSYNLKSRNFIRLYTQSNLTDGMFLKGLNKLWQQYRFDEGENKMKSLINKININSDIQGKRFNNLNQPKLHIQQHQGLILSLKDRYDIDSNHLMRFHQIKKQKDVPTFYTTKQRKQEMTNVEYVYLQKQGEDDNLKIEISILEAGLDQSILGSKQINSKLSLVQFNKKQSYFHISSKEPVSALKNISLNDLSNVNKQTSNQYNMNRAITGPNSTKSVTAWPSSRYFNGKNQQKDGQNTGKFSNNQGSLVQLFNSKNTTNIPSTQQNSQVQTPQNSSQINQRLHQQNGTQSQPYSAFVTRAGSLQRSLIGESDNTRLLDLNKQENEVVREHQKQNLRYEKLGRKFEVDKIKQINQIMKQIVKVEQSANIQMYQRFNRQEKELIEELRDKERERLEKEQHIRRQQVIDHQKNKKCKSSEREFAVEFNQIRNMISKQSRIGEAMKLKNKMMQTNRERVQSIKVKEKQGITNKSLQNSQQKLKPLMSTVFDSSAVLSIETKNYQRIPMTAVHSPRTKGLVDNKKVYLNSSHNLNDNYFLLAPRTAGHNEPQCEANSDYQQIETKLFEFGMKQSANNSYVKYRHAHKLTFIEENYPISVNLSIL